MDYSDIKKILNSQEVIDLTEKTHILFYDILEKVNKDHLEGEATICIGAGVEFSNEFPSGRIRNSCALWWGFVGDEYAGEENYIGFEYDFAGRIIFPSYIQERFSLGIISTEEPGWDDMVEKVLSMCIIEGVFDKVDVDLEEKLK